MLPHPTAGPAAAGHCCAGSPTCCGRGGASRTCRCSRWATMRCPTATWVRTALAFFLLHLSLPFAVLGRSGAKLLCTGQLHALITISFPQPWAPFCACPCRALQAGRRPPPQQAGKACDAAPSVLAPRRAAERHRGDSVRLYLQEGVSYEEGYAPTQPPKYGGAGGQRGSAPAVATLKVGGGNPAAVCLLLAAGCWGLTGAA